jgi:hypothetical protein
MGEIYLKRRQRQRLWGILDADYEVSVHILVEGTRKNITCPYYSKWRNMINRCYSKKFINYEDCFICEEWRYFSNFKAWMEKQDWEGKHLDKDLLVEGNKVYSPNTCCFLEPRVNQFITDKQNNGSLYPTGVSYYKKNDNYSAQCKNRGKKKFLGYFETPEQAHQAYLEFKHKLALELAETLDCPKQKEALSTRYLRNVE